MTETGSNAANAGQKAESATGEQSAAKRTSEGVSMRRSRRRPIHGVLVAIDAPEVADKPWVVDAIDINANGIGLVLPPEVPAGTHVLLSFRLDEIEFSRVPAVVRHHDGLSGGARFERWPDADRLQLLEYLVGFYEARE